MPKFLALLNIIAWAGFWAFGYLALTAPAAEGGQMVTAALLAALGAGVGLWAYFRLVRWSEATGYARPANRKARAEERAEELAEETEHPA